MIKRLLLGFVVIASVLTAPFGTGEGKTPAKTQKPKAAAAVKVNRTVPQVEPPAGPLPFSSKPTPEEFFRVRLFAEPLAPDGVTDAAENGALVDALRGYAKRNGPDDFSALTAFLQKYPKSAWRAALLTNLGLEYYRTAHYSLALTAWTGAWAASKDATDSKVKGVADRAAGELAYMYARLGRMEDLEPLLNSVKGRIFVGPATERISGARAGLSNMKDRPEIAFRCGPLALHSIKLAIDPKHAGTAEIIKSASTQKGFSLPQVAELSKKINLNYQMAFRAGGAAIVVPSVVHWKVGHYAAILKQEGDRYLVKDPTFQNDVWATRAALEAESSGYFLVASGKLPLGWRSVDAEEGGKVWGRGNVCCRDPNGGPGPPPPPPCMAVATVDLMRVSLTIEDAPVGYAPPVGPKIDFGVIYQQREANQPVGFNYSSFGPKWTFGWLSYITDNPISVSADVNQYLRGGGTRIFTGFDPTTQTFAYQQYGQDELTRTSASSYELTSPDGSKEIFGLSDGSTGTTRKVFLTQVIDPAGNSVSLTYDSFFRVVAVTDAIGQVSTLAYTNTSDIYKITKITDPFGRFASFGYDSLGRLITITDVIGIVSQFGYDTTSDFINALTTPYGTTTFIKAESGTTASLDSIYPDGERDRVEFNESTNLGIPQSLPANQLPQGMSVHNDYMSYRNTFVWGKNAYASSYPDYTKARIYHWCHTADGASASAILESEKAPLESRTWYDYAGQADPIYVGTINKPNHVGRVLDDGTTQLFTNTYDNFGHLTKTVDPVGRTTSYVYAPNGIDLLETRQTRGSNNELLAQTTYNTQHRPLTVKDAAAQTTTYTYNGRGQILTVTDPKNETKTYNYDANGYRLSIDGPLSGSSDTVSFTYDGFGRIWTQTDETGYTLTSTYDALDRLTRATFPDGSYYENTYTALDITNVRDRAGRNTVSEYNPLRHLTKRTDPLGRVTLFDWCKCGSLSSITDAEGRATTWESDVEDRPALKTYPDGSKVQFFYEKNTSRLQSRIDEKLQVATYNYNRDDTLRSVTYGNSAVATAANTFAFDPNYERLTAMTDASGTTHYTYVPITGSTSLGAGEVASIDGPLANDTIVYGYDELGRRLSTTINGISSILSLDAAHRVTSEVNVLGTFNYSYDGASHRRTLLSYPNGQTAEWAYGSNAQDRQLLRITNKNGATAISEFIYTRDVSRDGRITTWSQQIGTQTPTSHTLSYDTADQLLSDTISNGGPPNNYAYVYGPAANRLSETVDGVTNSANFNALNELTSNNAGAAGVTYEWDAEQRLSAVNAGVDRTEFTYDALGRRVRILKLTNGNQVSDRRFVWSEKQIWEERTAAGAVTKRYFDQGMKIESGPTAGNYFYTRDHLESVRELVDGSGAIRARYSYDPYGRRSKLSGDLEADFGFAEMLWSSEANLDLALARAYDPNIGRWLSRDPLPEVEVREGTNLYAYVRNNPINLTDPLGLCCPDELANLLDLQQRGVDALQACLRAAKCGLGHPYNSKKDSGKVFSKCIPQYNDTVSDQILVRQCRSEPCTKKCPPPAPPPAPPAPPPGPGGPGNPCK